MTEKLHVFTPAMAAAAAPVVARPSAISRALGTSTSEPKRLQVASPASADESRQALEKAKTLPLAEARQAALGLAKTQPLAPVVEPPRPARRVRPVAQLPFKPVAAPTPIAPAATPITKKTAPVAVPAPSVRVAAPAVTAGIVPRKVAVVASKVDDGWSQGRKRRVEPASPLRPLKVAEGTQPGVNKPALTAAVPRPAGKQAVPAPAAARPAKKPVMSERAKLAEGSIPPPAAPSSGKPLPSLFSVIDSKKSDVNAAASSRLPGLPPPPPSRPSIGPKKAVSTVVAAASLGSAHMAIAQVRQTGEHSMVPPPAQMLLDDEVEEIHEIEDLPDFVPSGTEAAGMLMRARTNSPAPLFDAPPRQMAMPHHATSFSAAEAAFFAAGEEMDTIDMDTEQETFEDLPGVERPSFWSRLKNRASAGQ
ncbi:MAG TPA: hypothetical protein VIG06_03220 [Kofleriaceae bacterium]